MTSVNEGVAYTAANKEMVVVISSTDAHVIADTFWELLPEDVREEHQHVREMMQKEIAKLDWKLMPIEEARESFMNPEFNLRKGTS